MPRLSETIFLALLLGGTLPLAAQPVLHCPNPDAPLADRWTWAIRESKPDGVSHRCWIGYSIVKMMRENSFTGSFSSDDRRNRPTLCEVIGLGPCLRERTIGRGSYDSDCAGTASLSGSDRRTEHRVPKEVGILFEVEETAPGVKSIREIKISNLSLHVDLGEEPLTWLGTASDTESVRFLEHRFDDQERTEVRRSIVAAVGMHPPTDEAKHFLTGVLHNNDRSSLREQAAFWLGQTDTDDALRELMNAAGSDQSERVREQAVFAISQMDSSRSIDALITLARKHDDASVRSKAMFWLGQKASKKSAGVLSEIAFNDQDTDIQKRALFALTQLPGGEGIDYLISIATSHPNPRIRKDAIFWLGQSDSDRALTALIAILKK